MFTLMHYLPTIVCPVLYVDKFRSLWNNLNPKLNKNNKTLLRKIKNNKIDVKKLAFMSHQELNPKSKSPILCSYQ